MRSFKLLAATAASAIAIAATPAFAAGTAANQDINNTATLTYQTGGVTQGTVTSNTTTFKVDRKVDLIVSEVGNAATVSVGGSVNQATTFTVRNTSNAALDFSLLATNQTGGAAPFGGRTDDFDVTDFEYYIDAAGGTTGTYDPGVDTKVTKLSNIAADTSVTVYVIAKVPAGTVDGSTAAIYLTAQAQELGTTTNVVQTAGADTPGVVDTVFADGALAGFAGDVARDGKASARDQYNVVSALVTLLKTFRVVSDPFNNTTNPKAIPGAVIEYCLIAQNKGGADATTVAFSDSIDTTKVDYVASSGFVGTKTTGTEAAGTLTCDPTDATAYSGASSSYSSPTFAASVPTLAKTSGVAVARFRVTIK